MATYTTTIKTLIEIEYPLGLMDYPIFDPKYRSALNKKITDHFQFREIGLETPALFVWWLNVKMREIMPYYNQLYESTLLTFNPLHNYTMNETSKKESVGSSEATGLTESTQTNQSNSKARNVHSDTPQGLLSLDAIESNDTYASDADINKVDGSATGTSNVNATNQNTVNNVDDYIKTVSGNNGMKSTPQLIQELRASFVNVDMLIIKELEPLFMSLY